MDNENLKGQPAPEDNDQAAMEWLEQLLASTGTAEEPPEEEAAPISVTEESEVFGQMVSPMEDVAHIGTDESAVSSHDMSDMADMELDKIMQEAMSDDWDISAIEREIMSEPIAEAFPSDSDIGLADEDDDPTVYADGGDDPDAESGIPRKVRPKKKNDYGLFGLPHLASVAIWAAICVFIGISLGRLIWVCAADILAFGRQDQDVVITIEATDDLDTITDKLYNAGLIKYKSLFQLYCQLADVEEEGKISAGVFTLNTQYDYHALVGGMSSTSSYRETIDVIIPEGYTCAQIFALLEEKGVCTAAELEQYCIENEFSSYWFLDGVEKGTKYCLEGFLFPNTYQFYINSSAKQVFIKLLGSFSDQFDEELQAQLVMLNERLAEKYEKNGFSQTYIDQHMLTVRDIVIVASIIEKESAYSGESPTIASVIYNRLTNPGSYPYLNMDSTTHYAENLDPELAALYDTYICTGLPAGAISNPGLYSLKAALDPEDTKYYFFALDNSGESPTHQFFKTYSEHQKFLESLGG